MRWMGRVARMGDGRSVYRLWWKILMKRNHFEDLGADGNIILKCILKKWDGEAWTLYGLAQDRGSWPAFVNAVINTRVP